MKTFSFRCYKSELFGKVCSVPISKLNAWISRCIVQFASGKGNLNTCGDFQSRHPSPCQTEHCTICNFVKESSESTLNPYAINALKHDDPPPMLDNKIAWKKIQDESKSCQQTRYLVTSGKTPSKISGKLNSEIRRLSSIATINNNAPNANVNAINSHNC